MLPRSEAEKGVRDGDVSPDLRIFFFSFIGDIPAEGEKTTGEKGTKGVK